MAEAGRPWFTLAALLFVAASLAFNYSLNFERSMVSSIGGGVPLFLFYCAFFGFPYLFMTVLYSIFYRRMDFWRKRGFIVLSIVAVAGLALEATLDIGAGSAPRAVPVRYTYLYSLCANNLLQALLWFVPPALYWYFLERKIRPLYGCTVKGFSLYPYLVVLALMAPFIYWASGGADFMAAYPRYKLAGIPVAGNTAHWLVLFELCYGLAYLSVEFYFRGFMTMALYRYLGSGAVPVMAVVYCYIHFQKPFLEALTSFFGGYLLGIISCYGGSIFGGVIAHLGTAWLMEAAALYRLWRM